MPVLETKGAASAQGYGLATSQPQRVYIEDTFSTWLYTGNGSTQTITNGIDLAGKGGLVWVKSRSAATDHALYDTARGATFDIASNTITAQTTQSTGLTDFLANGFSIGSLAKINTNAATYASWTFREQARFFDIVTYTGNGAATQTITHNLGSVPGCIIVKAASSTGAWFVYHRSLGNDKDIFLNTTGAERTGVVTWDNYTPTATDFKIASAAGLNTNGTTYVAYLFAHDAGGFGATGTDNVISCGSYTGNGSATGPVVTLGYEPQWLLIKIATTTSSNWNLIDNMRGFTVGAGDAVLNPNLTAAESAGTFVRPTATGFQIETSNPSYNAGSQTFIYIAIRRGPMKTPTVGTSVFAAASFSSGVGAASLAGPADSFVNQRPDLSILADTGGAAKNFQFANLLRGYEQTSTSAGDDKTTPTLSTASTAAETTSGNAIFVLPSNGSNPPEVRLNTASAGGKIGYIFRRAPGFFDVVCYTGTGTNTTQTHNLGVVPELIIVKGRSGATAWQVYSSVLANTEYLVINTTAAKATGATRWNSTTPTSTVFSLGTASEVNTSSATYVAYLFATVAGVSKVGSYTGTGATLTVNCGFTTGARFVLVKRTDMVGDWYVWDSARGIVAGNDPYLVLNSTAAEVTITDWVDTAASGFELSNSVGNLANVIGGTYIFLSVA